MKYFVSLAALCCLTSLPAVAQRSAQIPRGALAVNQIQDLTNWQGTWDSGTSGSSTGQTSLQESPSLSGSSREFYTTYTNSGGERYWVPFGGDTAVTHFVYDGWIYIASPSNGIANIEIDTDQVMSNGQTVIFGVQCDGYSGTWDVTKNAGTPQNYKGQWVHSKAPCNPRKWATNTWHHLQIQYSRDDFGNVSYKAVWFDGAKQSLNATVPSAFALGWGSVLLTNFQIDGLGASGSSTVYLDQLTIYRW
jgi:hypothetical protein